MGPQQIFILVLVTMIIGIATIVAIDTMEEAHIEANKSAVRQDILTIFSDAQKYYLTPSSLDGGGKSFNNISSQHIVTIDPSNKNGDYNILGNNTSVTVSGKGNFKSVRISATATIGPKYNLSIQWADSL